MSAAAWIGEKESASLPEDELSLNGSDTQFGFTFLTGVEYASDPHWSARVQYNFYFGNDSVTLSRMVAGQVNSPIPISTELRVNTVTAGVNYRF